MSVVGCGKIVMTKAMALKMTRLKLVGKKGPVMDSREDGERCVSSNTPSIKPPSFSLFCSSVPRSFYTYLSNNRMTTLSFSFSCRRMQGDPSVFQIRNRACKDHHSCATSTPLYLILPLANFSNASSIPSFVSGNDWIIGLIRCLAANSSIRAWIPRGGTVDPWMRSPLIVRGRAGNL